MARVFNKPNVGSTGRRRIVPMMGIDFIAGDIERKGRPARSGEGQDKPYGIKGPSIGGRTRKWSFINFLQVNSNAARSTAVTQSESEQRLNFANAVRSANATVQNLTAKAQITADFINATVRVGVNPNNYATERGWVAAVRFAQIKAGQTITPTTDTWPPQEP